MSKISGKETKPEIFVRKFLFSHGFRYRKNDKRYPGRPDIVIPRFKKVIFVQGCFWHGHNCKSGKLPESRKEFWNKKILDNIMRDLKNHSELEALDWKILLVWQCEITKKEVREKRMELLVEQILS